MTFAQGHALLIGVGSYEHSPRRNVPITVEDARSVAGVLVDPQLCGYPAAQVTLLHDADATRDGILAALDALATRATADDTVLLFYGGHGEYDAERHYYLTSHDTRFDDAHVVPDTGVSQQALLAKLQQIPAKRVLLIFNACHAGELAPTLGDAEDVTGQALPDSTRAALLATGAGRIIITACREHQVSFVGNGATTIFTQTLVAGLRGQGISSQRGYISAFDLYTHVYFAVMAEVERTINAAARAKYGGTPEPELTVLKGVGPFAVSLYRGASAVGTFPADQAPPDDVAVRQVSPAQSQWALTQSINQTVSGVGAVGIAGDVSHSPVITGSGNTVIQSERDTIQAGDDYVGGDKIAGDKISGDKIDAPGSQGFINRPTGPINQNYSAQRNIDTGGGDYAEGNIDKRQGAFVSGGTVYGPVVGSNQGNITTSYGGASASGSTAHTLHQMIAQVRQAVAQAQQRGDDDLAEDLGDVVTALSQALTAEQRGNAERRAEKLRAAQTSLAALVTHHPELRSLGQMLDRGLSAED